MLRWNGWGYQEISYPLSETMLVFLKNRLGEPFSPPDVSRKSIQVPASYPFLQPHPSLITDENTRLFHARGQSFPDLIAKRLGQIRYFPDAVAFPEHDEQVGDLLRWARLSGAQVIPFGGGTSVVGGVNPSREDERPVVTISMARLNDLRGLDESSGLATFGAGVTGPFVESQLRAHGFTLGHFPQSFEHSTLGGWIATRSSGQQSLGYGRIEGMFAGGTMESPIGKLHIPSFPASAAGPDLRHLVLGSEGRLGIITEAVVRVRRLPEREGFYGIMFPDWASGLSAAYTAIQTRLPLSMMRLSNPTETEVFLQLPAHQQAVEALRTLLNLRGISAPSLMLFGVTGSKTLTTFARREMASIARQHKGLWLTQIVGQQWARSRFRSAYLRDALWDQGYAVETLETAVPWSVVSSASEAILHTLNSTVSPILPMVHLSHFYPDGASLYFTFIFRVGQTAEETLARWQSLKSTASRAVLAAGGTISHHHGVGSDHRKYLPAEKGMLGLQTLEAVQQMFDPDKMMNPGKML